MKTYTYYIEFKKRCAETVTIEAPTYGDDQNVWTTAEDEYEADEYTNDELTKDYNEAN